MIPVLIYILCVLVIISSLAFSNGAFVTGGVILGAVLLALIVMCWSKRDRGEAVVKDKLGGAIMAVFTLIVSLFGIGWSRYYNPSDTAFLAAIAIFSVMFLIDLSRRTGIITGYIWFSIGLSLWLSLVPFWGHRESAMGIILITVVVIYSGIAFARSVFALRQKDTV